MYIKQEYAVKELQSCSGMDNIRILMSRSHTLSK